jgi:predicted nucleic acid-binding Zn ribbon protein
MILFDFKCNECGKIEEHMVPQHIHQIVHLERGNKCKGVMTRQISPVRSILDGTDPGFPSAYEKWARDHEKAGQRQS